MPGCLRRTRVIAAGRAPRCARRSVRRPARVRGSRTRNKADRITKVSLAGYYVRRRDNDAAARARTPHHDAAVPGRHRSPNAACPDYFFPWIKRAKVRKQGGGSATHALINNAATLVFLADQACVTPHIWLSRADKRSRRRRALCRAREQHLCPRSRRLEARLPPADARLRGDGRLPPPAIVLIRLKPSAGREFPEPYRRKTPDDP